MPNRIVKTAICEGLADFSHQVTQAHVRLYECWAKSGAGLLITGAMQIDRRYLDRPGDIVIEGPQAPGALDSLKALAAAAKSGGALCFMQLSHAGLKADPAWCTEFLGPSGGRFGQGTKPFEARALSGAEIEDAARRFVLAAGIALDCGFDGVQILAGQGRLLGAFLSPVQNQRIDQWGGDLQNRARLLLDCVRSIRAAYGPRAALSVKLSLDDTASGGLAPDEALLLSAWLSREGVDLIEVSQGAYGTKSSHRPVPTEIVKRLRSGARVLVLTSGHALTRTQAEEQLNGSVFDCAGFARAFCADPDFANKLINGSITQAPDLAGNFNVRRISIDGVLGLFERASGLESVAETARCALAMRDLSEGRAAPSRRSAQSALSEHARREAALIKGMAA